MSDFYKKNGPRKFQEVNEDCHHCTNGRCEVSEECSNCNGKGYVGRAKTCSKCNGWGNVTRRNGRCSVCDGKGYITRVEEKPGSFDENSGEWGYDEDKKDLSDYWP